MRVEPGLGAVSGLGRRVAAKSGGPPCAWRRLARDACRGLPWITRLGLTRVAWTALRVPGMSLRPAEAAGTVAVIAGAVRRVRHPLTRGILPVPVVRRAFAGPVEPFARVTRAAGVGPCFLVTTRRASLVAAWLARGPGGFGLTRLGDRRTLSVARIAVRPGQTRGRGSGQRPRLTGG